MAEQMKPSGIDWIGDIPNEWDIKRIKYLAQLKGRIGWQGLTSDEYTDVGPFLITGVDFSNGGINWENCVHITEERWAEAPEIHIKNGDLLITKDGTVGKVAIVENLQEKASLNSGVLLIKTSNGYNKKFLYWALLSEEFWTWFRLKNAGNSTIVHLYQNDFAEFSYTFPNAAEQKAIADYLDQECAQIDSIAADLEKQIELLQQYKKSLITETVTKGLDKTVPMKDSGVEWLGKIPEHWDVEPIKYRVTFHNGDRGENYPSKSELQSEGIPFINAGHLEGDGLNMDNMDYISEEKYRIMGGVKLRSGDILYCLRGSVGKNAIVDMNQGTVASSLVAIRSVRISAKYLYYCLNSHIEEVQRYLWDNGTAQPNLSADNLGKYKICIPPVEEQMTIVEYLNNICSQIDNLIIGKRKQLSTIQQHKKSLIYEYVTGKKRVKEVR